VTAHALVYLIKKSSILLFKNANKKKLKNNIFNQHAVRTELMTRQNGLKRKKKRTYLHDKKNSNAWIFI